ncbi:Retrovirus-related Pol polyprotein from transposon TNT 1-94 [Gossypium australe]|uniref:Retrovirus-related Pol polyprotein from transposon TNT 1-94 n=1 Tax=Gossypium australe TaxID=47621 RepID=A0A5B6VP70_9ROSI|nr:Retrovirus-related Pol polyprotein from transposon TNT 1-94 [Gossypium australe]
MVHLDNISSSDICFMAHNENVYWLWYRRLGHASMSVISKLIKNEFVVGMPNFPINFDKVCDAYAKVRHRRASFNFKNIVSTSKVVQLIHINPFGPIRTMSLGGYSISSVRSDHGKEFENLGLDNFCNEHGSSHNFLASTTSQ